MYGSTDDDKPVEYDLKDDDDAHYNRYCKCTIQYGKSLEIVAIE